MKDSDRETSGFGKHIGSYQDKQCIFQETEKYHLLNLNYPCLTKKLIKQHDQDNWAKAGTT